MNTKLDTVKILLIKKKEIHFLSLFYYYEYLQSGSLQIQGTDNIVLYTKGNKFLLGKRAPSTSLLTYGG